MTKTELIEKMAEDAGITKTQAADALESIMSNITNALKKEDGKVTLLGFGTFVKVRRKARKARNFQTGMSLTVNASQVVKFKPGKKLREGGPGGGR